MTDWQPIETAPTDRTHVLVAQVGEKPVRAYQTPGGGWYMHGRDHRRLEGAYSPTHWMLLPSPPVQER